MPLTKKGEKIMSHMKQEYGPKKGEGVFYASANNGTISGVHPKDSDDPNAVQLMGPFNPKSAAKPSIDPPRFHDNMVPGTGELAGEIVKVLPDNISAASINEANKKLWRSAGG
jgi:hypothetical protein